MKKLLKRIITICVCVLIVSSPSLSYAENFEDTGKKDYGSDFIEVDPNNIESISKAIGIPEEKISSVKVYYDQSLKIQSNVQRLYLGSFRITSGPKEVWGINPATKTYGTGGTGGSSFSRTYKQGLSFSQNNTIGLTSSTVSAELGFGSNLSYSITDTFSSTIPAGSSGYLYVYPIYDSYTFNIYNIWGNYAGNGSALRPIGLGFVVTW